MTTICIILSQLFSWSMDTWSLLSHFSVLPTKILFLFSCDQCIVICKVEYNSLYLGGRKGGVLIIQYMEEM